MDSEEQVISLSSTSHLPSQNISLSGCGVSASGGYASADLSNNEYSQLNSLNNAINMDSQSSTNSEVWNDGSSNQSPGDGDDNDVISL